MTDMRATERLLEVIEEHAGAHSDDDLAEVLLAVQELRRRGDTIVHARDLRVVADARLRHAMSKAEQDDAATAWERIENALGGKL